MTTRSAPATVLIHGVFADASGFGGASRELRAAGHCVAAPPNPLRSLAFDAASVAANLGAIPGPIVLWGIRTAWPPPRMPQQRRRTAICGRVRLRRGRKMRECATTAPSRPDQRSAVRRNRRERHGQLSRAARDSTPSRAQGRRLSAPRLPGAPERSCPTSATAAPPSCCSA
jgi:hypothetical protein